MIFTVTRSSGVIIQPCESTPRGTLKLSFIDRMLQTKMRAVLVYQHGGNDDVVEVIRKALSKVLVPYYPLAGRLKESGDGEVQVACTGEGAWFIKASADCTLNSVDYFNNTSAFCYDDLMPNPPPESYGMEPLVEMQVTRFACGGFVIGGTLNHSLLDGVGSAQFYNAMGELARGFLHPTVAPVWFREAIRTPPHMLAPPPPTDYGEDSIMVPNVQLEHATIDISLERINQLKKEFLEFGGDQRCSTFDVMVADLWRHWTLALDFEKHIDVTLHFAIDAREFLNPPLPKGFYGNCVFPATITTSVGWLLEASNAEVVKLVKEKKAKAPIEFIKWVQSEKRDGTVDPFAPNIAYTTLAIGNWSGLGFNKVDYGWGSPIHVFPFQQGPCVMPYAVLVSPPTPNQGIRWMTWCVSSKNLPSFVNGYRKESLSRL